MPNTITVDNAVDDAGDGGIESALLSLQSAPPPVTLDSIMDFLVALKAELDAVKVKSDLLSPVASAPASVTIEISCRPNPTITI